MYADDTTLTSSAEDPYVLEHEMNYDMDLIQSWLTANKLTLNVKKTKYMLIGSKFKSSQIHNDFTVKVHNTPLDGVAKHKTLGVHIDESTSKKIFAGLAILKRVSTTVPFDTRMNMYNALVMPYFNCCSTAWGNIGKRLSDKIQKLQNRAARILTFSNYETRSSILLDELGWESLENKRLAMIMYKIHNDLSPSYLRCIFTNTSNAHAHNRRNSKITEYAKGSLHYRGSFLWNKIPSEIRHLSSLKLFKTSLNGKDCF